MRGFIIFQSAVPAAVLNYILALRYDNDPARGRWFDGRIDAHFLHHPAGGSAVRIVTTSPGRYMSYNHDIGSPPMTILVTGAAGFIGYHLSLSLLMQGEKVTGIDNLNDYYDVSLKQARLSELESHDGFSFYCCDIADRDGMTAIVKFRAGDDRYRSSRCPSRRPLFAY